MQLRAGTLLRRFELRAPVYTPDGANGYTITFPSLYPAIYLYGSWREDSQQSGTAQQTMTLRRATLTTPWYGSVVTGDVLVDEFARVWEIVTVTDPDGRRVKIELGVVSSVLVP
jgi:hypothetical protein